MRAQHDGGGLPTAHVEICYPCLHLRLLDGPDPAITPHWGDVHLPRECSVDGLSVPLSMIHRWYRSPTSSRPTDGATSSPLAFDTSRLFRNAVASRFVTNPRLVVSFPDGVA